MPLLHITLKEKCPFVPVFPPTVRHRFGLNPNPKATVCWGVAISTTRPSILAAFSSSMYPGLFNSSYKPNTIELAIIHDPSNSIGAYLVGQYAVTLLQGVLFVQYYNYFGNFPEERGVIRWFVHGTFATCLVKFAFLLWYTWDKFSYHYGDWAYLLRFSPLTIPLGISNIIPCLICQIFYIYRCWRLSYNIFFAVPAVLSFIVTAGSGVAQMSLYVVAARGSVEAFKILFTLSSISLVSGFICDVCITVFTCFYLLREGRGLSVQGDSLIFRIVRLSIESAMGPLIVALANLILNFFFTNTNSWFALPNLILSHAYGCSLLYTVNARKTLSRGLRTMVLSEGIVGPRHPITISANMQTISQSTIERQQYECEAQTRECRVSFESDHGVISGGEVSQHRHP